MAATTPTAELDGRFSSPGVPVTPWAETERAVEKAELFWISTVRADDRPHVTPLVTVWQDGALYFTTGASEQKNVNLAKKANCILMTGNNRWKEGLDVVVEGAAERITDETHLQRLADAWDSKYRGEWHFDVANNAFQGGGGEALVYRLKPTKIIAFAKGAFAQTRYRF